MKLKELLEAVRGLDDKAFLERFPHPFLLEEGLLRHETRSVPKPGENGALSRMDELSERQVFPIHRRDAKDAGDVALGRGALMDIRLDAQSVSSRHAVFKPPGDGRTRWVVVDTVSTNGTFVDGIRIATGREVELSEATVLRFGPDLRLAFYESQQLLQVLRNLSGTDGKASAPNPLAELPTSANRLPPTPTLRRDLPEERVEEENIPTEFLKRDDIDRELAKIAPPSPGGRGGGTLPMQPKAPPPRAPAAPEDDDEVGEKTETELQAVTTPLPPPARPSRPQGPAALGAESVVVLSCEPFAPLPLELHRPVCIGRVPGNDFVLPNPQVSRRHCECERVREGVVVRDLKSANGTFYEERRIERQLVPFQGSFRIGPYSLEVRSLDAAAGVAPGFGDTMISARNKAEGLRGTFEDMPLTEILSGVEFNQKTGVIDIQGEDGTAGFVSFRGGAPHQARCGKLENEPAVLGLLSIRRGRFILRSDEAAVGPRGIEATFTKILLQHGKIADESARRGGA
jgi:pSer/pThr/pTyr-binding forkhead associated (FHA) protein